MKYTDLKISDRIDILRNVQGKENLSCEVIEKDWWVTQVLRAMYSLPYSQHLSFKGGTSLSKCWNLISRFSEDVDVAIDREYLGFSGVLSKNQISDKLRRAACSFVREKMQFDIANQLKAQGLSNHFEINVNITAITTTDPEIVEVIYKPSLNGQAYVRPKVVIEISGRSMSEPVAPVMLGSIIDKYYPGAPFSEALFEVRAVLPERTFLEKIFLLHEEFAKPKQFIRIERMSRHMYDILQILRTPIAENAIRNEDLYRQVINHRRAFIGLKGFDYNTLYPATLSIIPTQDIIAEWRKDYQHLCSTMIYGGSISFDEVITELRKLNERIKLLPYSAEKL